MSICSFRSITTINDQAEGESDALDYPEMHHASRTGVAPAIRIADDHGAPAAETGILTAVVAEGRDNTEAQDASRTTAEQSTSPASQEPRHKTSAPSVMIIEDSTELAEIIEATLRRLDMVTTHETHGSKAFNRYPEVKPDVVLLDIGLPDMTGWRLLEHIREQHGNIRMPKVIIITAYGDPANRLIGKLQNVHDYLIKPFTAEEVERIVLGALSSAGR
jgi:CheY-like chemotaxis protein